MPTEMVPTLALDTLVNATLQDRLASAKNEIRRLFFMGEAIMFEIVRLVRFIESERLFMGEIDPDTGAPFTSMSAYLPHLLNDVRENVGLPEIGLRTFREYMALERVYVQGLNIAPKEIMTLGVSHFTALRERLDYNPRTGEIATNPAEGKLGLGTALEVIDNLRGGEWRLSDFCTSLAAQSGAVERSIDVDFYAGNNGKFYLRHLTLWENGVAIDANDAGLTADQVLWLFKRLGLPNHYYTALEALQHE